MRKTRILVMVALAAMLLALGSAPARACWDEEVGTCSMCNGSGARECNYCNGGTKNCTFCHGSGTVVVSCPGCGGRGFQEGDRCPDCGGSRKVQETCDNCSGTGTTVCGSCEGRGITECFGCSGTGQTVIRKTWNPNCGVDHSEDN